MFQRSLESAEFTSASPGHINNLIQVNAIESPDFETEIKNLIKEDRTIKTDDRPSEIEIQKEKKVKGLTEKLDAFDKGHVGEVQRLSSEAFGNVKSLANNPTSFIFQTFMKKFAKGAGVIALALLIFEAVQWIIGELLKPGRWLDRRFRRDIEHEIMAFRSREEKQKLNQGINSVIVTSIGGLRGGNGQTFYTQRTVASGESLFPKNFTRQTIVTSGLSSKRKGRGRYGA